MDKKFIKNLASQGAKAPLLSCGKQFYSWLAIMVVYTIMIIACFGVRHDFAYQITQPVFFIEILLILATSFCAGILVSFLALPDVNQQYFLRQLPVIFFALLCALIAYQYVLNKDVVLEELCGGQNYECALGIVIFAMVPSLIFLVILQRGATTHRLLASLMIGLCGGSFSYFLLRIIHATQNIVHLFLWHLLPISFVIILSILIAKITVSKL